MNPTEPTWKSFIVETTEPIFTPQQCQLVIDKGMSLKKEVHLLVGYLLKKCLKCIKILKLQC